MVVSFDTSAELVADLTDDTEKLENAHPEPAPRRRHGAVTMPSYFACRDKLAEGPAAR